MFNLWSNKQLSVEPPTTSINQTNGTFSIRDCNAPLLPSKHKTMKVHPWWTDECSTAVANELKATEILKKQRNKAGDPKVHRLNGGGGSGYVWNSIGKLKCKRIYRCVHVQRKLFTNKCRQTFTVESKNPQVIKCARLQTNPVQTSLLIIIIFQFVFRAGT